MEMDFLATILRVVVDFVFLVGMLVVVVMVRANERPRKNSHGEWTDRRTDGHRDSMTDPAKRAESVKILYIYILEQFQN